MTESELTAILSYVNKDESLARRLFEKYGRIENILAREVEELVDFGCDYDSAVFLKLLLSVSRRGITDLFKAGKTYAPLEVENYLFALFFGEAQERVFALLFDSRDRFLSSHALGTGGISSAAVIPRRLVALAQREGASRLILAHNHPAGSPEPSEDDISATEYLKGVLSGLGIDLVAHYVYAGHEFRKIQLK